MKAIRLRTEYLDQPLGLGIRRPRFSWNCDGGIVQTAYRIIVTRDNETLWDSGKVPSNRMVNIRYDGAELGSRDRVEWTVNLWDENNDAGESASTAFELGLLDASDWHAQWITGDYVPNRNHRYPVDCFRKTFARTGTIARARLYITAHGIYDASLNGHRVGDIQLAPGSTDYRTRVQYQTYDVTDQLADENTLEVRLADGWYRGSIGAYGPTNVFGRTTQLLAQLEINYADGRTEVVGTDPSFRWSNDGPIRFADLKDGEVYDARLAPTYEGSARTAKPGKVPTAGNNVPTRVKEQLSPALVITPSGSRVLDFGQNIAGFVEFAVIARSGQTITLRMAEILDADGEFTQKNFQLHKPVNEFGLASEKLLMAGQPETLGELQPTPKQQIDYTCEEGLNRYRTAFAVFGFRYALIETDVEFEPHDFRALAVYSDMEQTGTFECSNPHVNQLVKNTRWSMKSNFLDVPTDCPTRERLGWTGDAQIFFDTAAYLMDVAPFFLKWLRDLRDAQEESGRIPAVVPYNGFAIMYDGAGGSVGWGDAAVLIPFRYWKRYDDADVLREFYPMMRAYAEFMLDHTGHEDRNKAAGNPYNEYVYEKGWHFGEWLEPQLDGDAAAEQNPSRAEEATAYLHYTMRHLEEIARELGEGDDAALFARYAAGAKSAYNHLFVVNGTIDTDRQAKLVRPLALGLLDGEVAARVGRRLAQAVENCDYRVGTGFLSTPFLLPVLTGIGRPDIAYRVLENERAPSWLAQIKAGATTVWEDWEGNHSRNHYSFGAVCQWLFDTVAGIRIAGENHFVIHPVPGGSLTHATATYQSMYGLIESSWVKREDGIGVRVKVPANATADVHLRDRTIRLQAGEHELTE